ncbi:gamma carbonic anhydrase family protein [Salinicola avicenniae]|uniref:gamma carbonic anhydrase family protein n=1 Tax=Salinicola avicenniae TaxID=2916836 RepID=UPI002073BC0C|nr:MULTISPECIES: gamma carbonic anhydrase family protein [unclassified Salinicola]
MPVYAYWDHVPRLPDKNRYWVAPGAHVIGQVELGEDVGIWFNVVIRGDNDRIVIGAGSNIQESVMLHTDPGFELRIGRGCTIGHHAILHGCTLGDNTLVGMGATVLNGAQVGNNCLIGASALVTEGKYFPDNSLIVGSPAKAIRTLDTAAVEGLKTAATHYVERWKSFATGLRCLEA